jgi:hypothetical protein
MPDAAGSSEMSEPPRLLLDTNVYFRLADRRLPGIRDRLLKVAKHRTPPLFWWCEVPFDELVCRLGPDDQEDFERHRRALWWMEQLCGDAGTAEDQTWVLRRGAFARSVPCSPEKGKILVGVRREILRTASFADLSADFRSNIDVLRGGYQQRIAAWITRRTTVGEAARLPRKPGEPGDLDVAADGVLDISRKHASDQAALWGPFKSDDDQKHAQRELIAFEVSLLQKARNPQPYNHANHPSDYNDYWLLAYCAAGYTIVTIDDRLRRTITNAGCVDPRLVTLDEGLARAEAWLASR